MVTLRALVFMRQSVLDNSGKAPPFCCIPITHTNTPSLCVQSTLDTPEIQQPQQQWQTINALIKCAIRLFWNSDLCLQGVCMQVQNRVFVHKCVCVRQKGVFIRTRRHLGRSHIPCQLASKPWPTPIAVYRKPHCLHSGRKKKAMSCETACSSHSEWEKCLSTSHCVQTTLAFQYVFRNIQTIKKW